MKRRRMHRFWVDLKRRRMFSAGALYAVCAWALVQATSIAFPAFGIPDYVLRAVLVAAFAGFPVALVLAWVFDLTPEGMRLDPSVTGNKRVFAVASLFVVLALVRLRMAHALFLSVRVDSVDDACHPANLDDERHLARRVPRGPRTAGRSQTHADDRRLRQDGNVP